MKGPYRLLISAAALCLCLAAAGQHRALLAQSLPSLPDTVLEVRLEGLKALPEKQVLADVKTRPGQPFSQEIVQADVGRLLASGRFDDVRATETQTDKGIIVTFHLRERPLVAAVEVRGNKSVKTKQLLELLTFKAGEPIVRFQIDRGAEAVAGKYRSLGYNFVKVALDEPALREGRQVIYVIEEGPKVTLRKVRFEGNKAFSDGRLKGQTSTRARLWPFISGVLDADAVERDVAALTSFYRSEGYLDARAGRLMKFSLDKRRAELSFVIEEGPRYRIARTVFEGNSVFSDEEIRRYLKLTQGSYYNALSFRRDLEKVRALYGEIGYIDARVAAKEVYPGPGEPVPEAPPPAPGRQPALVDLAYTILEGEQFRVGRIDLRGNTVTKMNVVRRQLQIRPGQLYNTVAVEETRNRLLETGLFNQVTISPIAAEPGVRNALVELEEAKTAQFLIGAGVSSNTGLVGKVSFTERNFDLLAWPTSWQDVTSGRAFKGAGQIFSLTAEPGTEFMSFRVDWREPYLFDLPISLGTRAFLFTAGRETYDETRYGGLVSLGHLFKNRWYGEVSGRIESIRADDLSSEAPPDVQDVAGTTTLVGTKGMLVRDTTDSRWLPSRGDRISLSYEQVMGDFVFGRSIADYHVYRTLYLDPLDRKHILAGAVSAGAICGDSPVFERFYGGGFGSIRGFDFRGISPRQGRYEKVVGGDFTLFAGAEYTFPLVGRQLRGVIFVDSGTVERDIQIRNYRVSAGFGIRLHARFFGDVPMSLDFGFPINKGDEDDTQLVSFSFGWVF